MTDDDDKKTERPALARLSKKSSDAMLKCIARPAKRSPLFWWLVDRHDELREVEAVGGLGIPWRKLCVNLAAEGITAAGGRPLNWETARKTWQRVRKEIVRAEQRRAQELAERDARRAADPRRNMPSRFPKGEYGPPLAAHQPAPAQSVVPAPRQVAAVTSATRRQVVEDEYWRDMVLPDCLKDVQIKDYDYTTVLDLRQFFRNDGVPEPWDDPNLDPKKRDGLIYRVIWSRAKDWARHLPYDRKNRSRW